MNFDSHVKEENKTIASHMMRIRWPWYALKNSNMSCGFNSISFPLLNKQWKRNKHFKYSFLAENFKLLDLLSDVFFLTRLFNEGYLKFSMNLLGLPRSRSSLC